MLNFTPRKVLGRLTPVEFFTDTRIALITLIEDESSSKYSLFIFSGR